MTGLSDDIGSWKIIAMPPWPRLDALVRGEIRDVEAFEFDPGRYVPTARPPPSGP